MFLLAVGVEITGNLIRNRISSGTRRLHVPYKFMAVYSHGAPKAFPCANGSRRVMKTSGVHKITVAEHVLNDLPYLLNFPRRPTRTRWMKISTWSCLRILKMHAMYVWHMRIRSRFDTHVCAGWIICGASADVFVPSRFDRPMTSIPVLPLCLLITPSRCKLNWTGWHVDFHRNPISKVLIWLLGHGQGWRCFGSVDAYLG